MSKVKGVVVAVSLSQSLSLDGIPQPEHYTNGGNESGNGLVSLQVRCK